MTGMSFPLEADRNEWLLLDVRDFAEVLDVRVSELRKTLDVAPESIPVPLQFRGEPYWPGDQIRLWFSRGRPEGFDVYPSDFVPTEVYRMSDNALGELRFIARKYNAEYCEE